MNYLCEIYFIKYVHKMEYMKSYIDTSKPDTLSCTYYIAKDLKVSNSEIFARLQGNHNSKFLDGRFSGIALKVIVKKSSGIKIIIEATKVEKKNVQDIIKFPDYPLQK